MNIPLWLNKDFLTEILEEKERHNGMQVEVLSFRVEPAVAPGNNYLSHMYRVRVQLQTRGQPSGQTKTTSLMIKEPFVEGFMKEFSEQRNFYGREPTVYHQLLPNFYKIIPCEFGPKSFCCSLNNVIVMTDLKEEGYTSKEKTKQLDFSHCKTVLTKLARFHAASVVCSKHNQDLMSSVGESNLFIKGSGIEPMVKPALKNFMMAVSNDLKSEKLANFLQDRYDQIWPSCTESTKPKRDGGLNVLNHGDLWVNNILFKYNKSGEPVDVKFVDYQLTRYSSPVHDLVYFIWTSANEEVRGKRQRELFLIYLKTLNTTLADLGCTERLTEQELKKDLGSWAVDWAVFIASYLAPFMMASPEDVPDFANLSDEDYDTEKFYKLFKGHTYNKLLPKYIQQIKEFFLERKGFLGSAQQLDISSNSILG